MGEFLAVRHPVLSDGVEFAEQSVLRYHAPAGPSLFVLCKNIVDDVGTVPNIVVARRDHLPRVSIRGKQLAISEDILGIDCRR